MLNTLNNKTYRGRLAVTINLLEDTKIIQQEIHDEMKTSYIDYAMSVIVGRALPDVRDGLKPVHRRILFGMSELGLTPDKAFKKSARIVGDVLGKYHPHGDTSVYDAMVRMAQDFSIRYMLVDGHGNFGSVDGDGAAAMRYTEARMTPLALQMLRDIDKETVDFIPNFDGDEKEPSVLPARYPNLLVNGSNGIAVGMATSIPPHNLGEVIDAAVKMIDDENCTVEDLIKIVKGPDFPTGATILGKNSAKEAYRTGQGKVVVRAQVEIEETNKGRQQIIVTEIPYQVNKSRLIEKIADLVKDKKIDSISDIRDESNRNGMRIVIELKKDANAQITLNRLYKHTQMQDSYSMIMIALVNGEPKILSLYQILDEYLKHQKSVVTRRTQYDLRKAEARAHILEGLRIALDNIEEIIKIIRSSYNDAKVRLMERFGLSEIQTQAILDMRLARLQGLEREKIENEFDELMKQITYFNELLGDEKLLMAVVKEELLEVRKKYADARRTKIVVDVTDIDEEDLIEEEQVAITLTHLGYIKRITTVIPIRDFAEDKFLIAVTKYGTIKKTPLSQFDTNRKAGLIAINLKEGDELIGINQTTGSNNVIIVTKHGKCICFSEEDVRSMGRIAGGVRAIKLEKGDEVVSMELVEPGEELLVVTKNGFGKRTAVEDYKVQVRGGKGLLTYDKAKFKKTGEIVGAMVVNEDDEILLINSDGIIIRIRAGNVSRLGRATQGVKIMRVDVDSNIITLAKVIKEDVEDLFAEISDENNEKSLETNKADVDQLKIITE